jgi:tetratricopeptide (TPR) repeat protein
VRPRPAKIELRSIRARGGLDEANARAIGEHHHTAVQACWFAAARHDRLRSGTMVVELQIAADGRVGRVALLRDRISAPRALRRCMNDAFHAHRFAPAAADRRARYTFVFRDGTVPETAPETIEAIVDPPAEEVVDAPTEPIPSDPEAAYAGNFAEVKRWLRLGEVERASSLAWAWRRSLPDDLMALVAVGEVAQARGQLELAARAFGSIAELHPSDAAMLRFAAGRLEALGGGEIPLSIDVLQEAERQRPDHPSSHQALAWALARRGRFAEAFDALARGYDNAYPGGRFLSARAELGEELRIVAAAWLRAQPKRRATIEARLAELGLSVAEAPSLRFVLTWETDVNDVDLHVEDGRGGKAWYRQPKLASGGSLLADVTTGFGPESFVIDGEPTAHPYHLWVDYYARGPMGYGMGQVQVIRHDGKGNLELESLPFVTMAEKARLQVGVVKP